MCYNSYLEMGFGSLDRIEGFVGIGLMELSGLY